MKNINWFVVATIVFLISAVVFAIATFVPELGYYGLGLFIAGWVCNFIGLKTR
jgi:hypothetical protein